MPRSTALDPSVLRETRYRLGWTQEELADRAGLGLRVVAKAESGKPVLQKTARAISGAFRSAGVVVELQNAPGDPLTVVSPILRAYRLLEGKLEAPQEFLSESLVVTIAGSPEWMPLAASYRGLEGFAQLWKQLFARVRRTGGNLGRNGQLLVAGQEVLVWGHEMLRPSASLESNDGSALAPTLVLMRFAVEQGRLVRFVLHLDPAVASSWPPSSQGPTEQSPIESGSSLQSPIVRVPFIDSSPDRS